MTIDDLNNGEFVSKFQQLAAAAATAPVLLIPTVAHGPHKTGTETSMSNRDDGQPLSKPTPLMPLAVKPTRIAPSSTRASNMTIDDLNNGEFVSRFQQQAQCNAQPSAAAATAPALLIPGVAYGPNKTGTETSMPNSDVLLPWRPPTSEQP